MGFRVVGLGAWWLWGQPAWAEPAPTVAQVLAAVDRNLVFDTRIGAASMIVDNGRRVRQYEMRIVASGADRSAIEYTAPERDAGTKILRLGAEVWLYQPAAEHTLKVSGHLLRDGVLGSDVSYDDLTRNQDLLSVYDGTLTGPVSCPSNAKAQCWRVELEARGEADVPYPRRIAWVDVATSIPVRQELFAASGVLLKTWEMQDVQHLGDRWFPAVMVVADRLREGSTTTLRFRGLTFGAPVPPETFTTRWLERASP
jgi:outer membrane lipoprotein-sorting protein